MWRYWRCWSQEDIPQEEEAVKHFHRYCDCDEDITEDIDDSLDEDTELELMTDDSTTDETDLSFESTFERDILLHFTDLSCHQVQFDNEMTNLKAMCL